MGETRDMAVEGQYAYVAANPGPRGQRQEWGLHVVDISDPAHPVRVGMFHTHDYTWNVAVNGGYAFVLTDGLGSNVLHVVDVSDPAQPKEIASRLVGSARSIAAKGRYLYLDSWGTPCAAPVPATRVEPMNSCFPPGMLIFDVSDPSKPEQVGRYDHFTFGTIVGTHIVGGTHDGVHVGIKVLDVSEPSKPREVAALRSWWPGDVWVQGEHVYAAAGEGGLWTFRFTPPPERN